MKQIPRETNPLIKESFQGSLLLFQMLVGKPFQAIINIILCLFFWLPGAIHAYMVVKEKKDDKRFKKYLFIA